MRSDMTRVVNQGRGSHKFRPFISRRVDCTPVLDAQEHSLPVRNDGEEPLELGRVRMRDKRIGWGDERDNTRYAPLRRWLRAQVGRRWDEVYGELSGKYLPRFGESLREWARGEVSQNCYRNDAGELLFNCEYGGVREATWNDYYVDPDTGILMASKPRARRRWQQTLAEKAAERAQVFRKGKGNLQYHKRNGVWYEVTVGSYSHLLELIAAESAAGHYCPTQYTMDSFTKRLRLHMGGWEAKELYGDEDLYSVSHRALSKRDCHRLNLR